MDSDDDYQSLSPPAELSPRVQFRRLKRLKKADSTPPKDRKFDSNDDPLLFSHVDFAKLEELENESEPQIFDESNSNREANISQESLSQGDGNETEEGDKMELGFDVEVKKTNRVLDFVDDVVGGSNEGGRAIGEDNEDFEPEKMKETIGEEDLFEKKQEKRKNKKVRREKTDSGDGLKTDSRGSNKRREEKERKAYLNELHAESQRLFREGEASFKPIPVVPKPISSVLEKIRKRKLEISKKSMVASDSNHGCMQNIGSRDNLMDLDRSNEDRKEENVAITVDKEMIDSSIELPSSLAASNVDEDAPNRVHANEEPVPSLRAPVHDTQDLFDDSEPIGATSVQDNEKPSSPVEEDIAPSLQDLNLKLDSGPVDDSSSEEEDNDKENCNPSPTGDPVKNFIDEEAEEEDDGDNDMLRFQENEADEEIDDFEELNDMIATEYEERSTDKERRNELHQKWLEQQDAKGTDNLMQRLNCRSVLREAFLLSDNEAETDEDDEKDEEIDDEAEEIDNEEDSLPKESGRINVRKAKQIILQLYSDKEDTYLSDEDDDTQRRRAQCLIRKEERATIALPADDASSREVFGLIKNLNIASDNKRKPKALSIFDSVLKGGSSGQSSKSSFLGRASNHHIPSSRKQGSATFRSFIFGREDSNSRSCISEESSNSVPQETRPARNLATKYSNSQTKARNQSTDGGVETISRTSLLEVLRRSSSKANVSNEETAVDLTKSMFAFRAPKKPTRVGGS